MFEFPMTAPETIAFEHQKRSRYTIHRLTHLAAVALKLTRAGWPVWLTMTGLSFEPPGVTRDDWYDDFQATEARVARMLAGLGVDEEFSPWAGKTVPDMPDGMASWMWDI